MRPSSLTKAMSSAAGTFCMWNWVTISRPKSKRIRCRLISSGVAHWKPPAWRSPVSAAFTRSAMERAPACTLTIRIGMPAKASRQRGHSGFWAGGRFGRALGDRGRGP